MHDLFAAFKVYDTLNAYMIYSSVFTTYWMPLSAAGSYIVE
jgi:hypothetical protein